MFRFRVWELGLKVRGVWGAGFRAWRPRCFTRDHRGLGGDYREIPYNADP